MKPKSEKMTLCSRGSDDNCNTILRPLPVEKTSARFLLRHLRRSWQECSSLLSMLCTCRSKSHDIAVALGLR